MRAFAWLAWPLRPITLTVFMLVSTLLPTSAAQPLTLVQIGSDPYTDPGQHRTAVEPDTFSYGSTIVAAFQLGRFSTIAASNIGWASSRDAGSTWAWDVLPGIVKLEGGPYDRATDPSVAYDAKHNLWMISSLALTNDSSFGQGRAILVSRSTDGGISWTSPVTVTAGGFPDKNWTVCDNSLTSPYYGNCYTQWTGDIGIFMSTSTDGGLTWGPPLAPAGSAFGVGGQPVVQPNGAVIVPFSVGNSILAFRSTDGGASWSGIVPVAPVEWHRPAGGLRSFLLPSAEIDGAGKVYVVWHDCRFRPGCTANDIVISTSIDGISWSPVTRIPIDDICLPVDHFIPGLAVDQATVGASARLALAFYYYPVAGCTPETCRLHVGFVSSDDGGASWSKRSRLAGPMQMSWLPIANGGRMVGDYISTSFVQGKAFPVFSVAGPPQGALFNQAIYTAVGDLNQPDELPCRYSYLPLVQNAMPGS